MPPILTLTGGAHRFGARWLFEDISLSIEPRDRLCLVGRNGTGKSTLLKILAGVIEGEKGERWVQPGTRAVYLNQEPDFSKYHSVEDAILSGLPDNMQEPYRAAVIADELALDLKATPATLSGGGGRRLALARAFAADPDLLFLDEPTNHLDLPAIDWLEAKLKAFKGALVVISHDRRLLTNVSEAVLWLERGQLYRSPKGFAAFEDWSQSILDAEEKANDRLNQHLKAELHWLARGVTARRKRNQGRLRKLEGLRAQKRNQEAPQGQSALNFERGEISGKMVVEAEGVAKSYGDKTIIRDFNTRILRGDRLGIIGPNGSGKSTLIGLLTGRISPDTGKIRLGTKLDIAHIDQRREDLRDDMTVSDFLTGGGDFIDVRGEKKHVAGYLKDFLFDPAQLRSPVQSLSGGERNRLLMAKAFARPINLVVLDEPTNDLDMETLDLLEDVLGAFDGTVILVSHDRDFLDRVVSSVIALDGTGAWSEHAGGYSDWYREAGDTVSKTKHAALRKAVGKASKKAQSKLSYKDARALDMLPQEMASLEDEIKALNTALADPDLFARDPDAFHEKTKALEVAQSALAEKEEQWLLLEMKREELAGTS